MLAKVKPINAMLWKSTLTLIIYCMWFLIADRSFDLTIAMFNLFLSYMAAFGIYAHCSFYKLKGF